jgi:hypothetical protein
MRRTFACACGDSVTVSTPNSQVRVALSSRIVEFSSNGHAPPIVRRRWKRLARVALIYALGIGSARQRVAVGVEQRKGVAVLEGARTPIP